MEKKNLFDMIAGAGSKAKDTIGKTVEKTINAIDQNDDGKIDMNDVNFVANFVGDKVKKGADAVLEGADESKKSIVLRLLQPIFPDTLNNSDFSMSKFIHVTERDKRYIDNEVCQGSIGYFSDKGGLRIVNIFKDSLSIFGLSLYPDDDYEFYYVNPTDRDNYIALDEYFYYMKTARVNELQRVAQDLGAKHFKVTYKEERIAFSELKAKGKAKVSKNQGAEVSHDSSERKFSMLDVAAEMNMAGHEPIEPKLVYLAKDDSIKNLIHMRMSGKEDFHNYTVSIKLSNSTGIKESDALKIDAVLKGLKVAGNATVSNEVKNESRRYLEYEIEF